VSLVLRPQAVFGEGLWAEDAPLKVPAVWLVTRGAVVYGVLGLSLVLTFGSWLLATRYREERIAERFERAVAEAEGLIAERMFKYEQTLRGGVALFASSDEVSIRDWRAYYEHLELLEHFPGIQGLGFARYLRPDEVEAFEQEMRRQGYPGFHVFPDTPRTEYTAIQLLEPWDARNLRAMGYDMFSDSTRRAAMVRARDTGRAALSGPVTLLQEIGGSQDIQPGVLMYLPVYDRDRTLASVEDRRMALEGYVYAPFRMHDLMEGILANRALPIDFRVYDGYENGSSIQLFTTIADAHLTPQTLRQVRTLSIAGRLWTVEYLMPSELARHGLIPNPATVAVAGFIIYPLAFAVLYLLGREKKRAVIAMQRAKRDLHKISRLQEAIFNYAGTAIVSTDAEGRILSVNPAAERLLGYPANALVGERTPRIFHLEEELQERAPKVSAELGVPVEAGLEVVTAFARAQQPRTVEWNYQHREGQRIPVLLSVTAVTDEQHRISGFVHIAQDISDYRRAQSKFDESQRRIQSLTEAMDLHALVSVIDREGRLIDVNDHYCRVSRYSRKELLGNDHSKVKSGVHPKGFFQEIWKTLRAGRVWAGEICNRAKDGTLYWTSSTIVPFPDAQGVPFHFVAIEAEITERKRDVVLLSETQTLAKVGGWEYYIPTRELIWTRPVFDIYGLPPDAQPSVEAALSYYHPDSLLLITSAFERALEDGTPWDLELKLITARRRTTWVRAKAAVEFYQDEPWRIVGTLQDIDEQRRQLDELAAREIRYRTLAALSPVGIFETDVRGTCLFVNDAWCAMTGLSGDAWQGESWTAAVHPADRAAVAKAWSTAYETRLPFQEEVRTANIDALGWVSVRLVPIRRDGAVTGYVGVGENISERKMALSRLSVALADRDFLLETIHRRMLNHLRLIGQFADVQAPVNVANYLGSVFHECAVLEKGRVELRLAPVYLPLGRTLLLVHLTQELIAAVAHFSAEAGDILITLLAAEEVVRLEISVEGSFDLNATSHWRTSILPLLEQLGAQVEWPAPEDDAKIILTLGK